MDKNENQLNLMDMAAAYAAEEGADEADLFKQDDPKPADTPAPEAPKKEKKKWTPDAKLLEGMGELNNTPVTYSKEEWKEDGAEEGPLGSMADADAKDLVRKTMNSLKRAHLNIEDAKARYGIKHLLIDAEAGESPGQYHAMFTAAAEDDDYRRGQEALGKLIEELKEVHPEWIIYYDDTNAQDNKDAQESSDVVDTPSDKNDTAPSQETPASDEAPDLKVVIDKRNINQVAWSPEEASKLKKARTIEVDIVEGSKLQFGEIYDMDSNMVDTVLQQYQSKVNSIEAALPASKYRATFTGLSYPEVLELSSSTHMGNLDGEWEKWSICFKHVRNQSIGPWEEYYWYTDPVTKKRVEIHGDKPIPENINPDDVHHVTKFHDFMMKTSYKDLQFMMWKILCATSMDQELVPIVCRALNHAGKECGHSYDWIYRPAELLDVSSILPAILEDMKETTEAADWDAIVKAYNSSPLNSNSTVELNSSGFRVIVGHISAYDYLTHDWAILNRSKDEMNNSPTAAAENVTDTMLPAIRGILIKDANGRWGNVTNREDIRRIVNTFDEIDWQCMASVSSMMLDPYDFKFALRGIVCPKCKDESSIVIRDMARLLFIVAQSLSNVEVELKKN